MDHYVPYSKMGFDASKPAPKDRSIFRKNIGMAMLNKEGKKSYLQTWDRDFTKRDIRENHSHMRDVVLEKKIEVDISKLLQDNFSFRFIIIENQRERKGPSGMERRLIGTLSKCLLCHASDSWLVQHTGSDGLVSSDMERMSRYVDNTKGHLLRESVKFGKGKPES